MEIKMIDENSKLYFTIFHGGNRPDTTTSGISFGAPTSMTHSA